MTSTLFAFSSPILPSRHEYNARTLNLPFDPLATARLLEGEIKRLEDLCEESKQRRDEKQADVAVLDRKLTSLRAQEHHEAEVTRKLSKAYARARGVDTTRPGVMSLVHAYSSTFGSLWELARTLGPPDSPPRRRAPSPDVSSPFDEFHECYMDSYVRPPPSLRGVSGRNSLNGSASMNKIPATSKQVAFSGSAGCGLPPSSSIATIPENSSPITGMTAHRPPGSKVRASPRAALGDASNNQRKRSLTDTDLAGTIEDFNKKLRFNEGENTPPPTRRKKRASISQRSYARRW